MYSAVTVTVPEQETGFFWSQVVTCACGIQSEGRVFIGILCHCCACNLQREKTGTDRDLQFQFKNLPHI